MLDHVILAVGDVGMRNRRSENSTSRCGLRVTYQAILSTHADHALYAAKKSGGNCPKWVPHATGTAASS